MTREQIIKALCEKQYIGDGVYVRYDESHSIVLTTENGIEVTNTISLEPEILRWLERYVAQVKEYLVMLKRENDVDRSGDSPRADS